MHSKQHLDSLAWALRHLEVFAASQLGAAGEEGLAVFRQTVDFLSGDLADGDKLREHLQTLASTLAAKQAELDNALATIEQMKDNETAAPPPAVAGAAPAHNQAVTDVAGKVSASFNELLLKMREFGDLPAELEKLIQETNADIAALTTLTESPTAQAPVGG